MSAGRAGLRAEQGAGGSPLRCHDIGATHTDISAPYSCHSTEWIAVGAATIISLMLPAGLRMAPAALGSDGRTEPPPDFSSAACCQDNSERPSLPQNLIIGHLQHAAPMPGPAACMRRKLVLIYCKACGARPVLPIRSQCCRQDWSHRRLGCGGGSGGNAPLEAAEAPAAGQLPGSSRIGSGKILKE